MSYVNRNKLLDYLVDNKIQGLSGAIFVAHDSPNGEIHYEQNITNDVYCTNLSEERADEIYRLITGPSVPIKECPICMGFLTEEKIKNHKCVPVERYEIPNW